MFTLQHNVHLCCREIFCILASIIGNIICHLFVFDSYRIWKLCQSLQIMCWTSIFFEIKWRLTHTKQLLMAWNLVDGCLKGNHALSPMFKCMLILVGNFAYMPTLFCSNFLQAFLSLSVFVKLELISEHFHFYPKYTWRSRHHFKNFLAFGYVLILFIKMSPF